jgi:hypothetical protein
MITRYSFGVMEIDGTAYREDVMILPDGSVLHPWWRASGHVVTVVDIEPILAATPAVLVVGTGNPGRMRPGADFERAIAARGIKVSILPTREAVLEFNRMSARGESCAGCFHFTC